MQLVRKAHTSRIQVIGICCEASAEQVKAIWSITSAALVVLLFCFLRTGKVNLSLGSFSSSLSSKLLEESKAEV